MNLQRVKKLSADKKFLPIKDGCRELAPCRGQGRAALVGFGAKPQHIIIHLTAKLHHQGV